LNVQLFVLLSPQDKGGGSYDRLPLYGEEMLKLRKDLEIFLYRHVSLQLEAPVKGFDADTLGRGGGSRIHMLVWDDNANGNQQ